MTKNGFHHTLLMLLVVVIDVATTTLTQNGRLSGTSWENTRQAMNNIMKAATFREF